MRNVREKDGSRVVKEKNNSDFLYLMSKFFSANFWTAWWRGSHM